jgi:hypothetical protein
MPAIAKAKNLVKEIEQALKLEAKEAVRIAMEYFHEFFPDLSNANVMLEEIEETDDGKCWLITLGYDVKRPLSAHQKMFQPEIHRAYKTFKIDSASRKVASMKIRSVN